MVFKLLIDPQRPEEVCATVHERTPLIDEIEQLVLQTELTDQLPGYTEDEIVMLKVRETECFITENGQTCAIYSDGKQYLIRKRLYALERLLPPDFERISKSAIANRKAIARFKVHLSGAVDAVFRCGRTECVSRRCFQTLKRRYGL